MDETAPTSRIAILGAGPIGLEAALAALDAGFDFRLYEVAPHAAGNVRRWGHVRLFTPWSMNVSERMTRHLTAAGEPVPEGAHCPTGDELAELLLDRLARLPDVAARLATGTRVVAVSRQGLLKHEEIGSEDRGAHPFRLVLRGSGGREQVELADAVLDCTGTYATPNALGDGGVPAPGECAAESRILRHIPDPGAEPSIWAGRRLLLVGAGHSAQTAICDLVDFAEEHSGTEIIWAMRRVEPSWEIDHDDPLPERSELAARAAEIAGGASPQVRVVSGAVVDSMSCHGEELTVELRRVGGERSTVDVDLVLALTGYIGDASLYRQLQVHECWATSGPMKLATALLGSSDDCLAQESHGVDSLISPEPGFFILGIKSYGRSPGFLMQTGYTQVDEVFSLLTS